MVDYMVIDDNWEKSTKLCVTLALRKLTMLERRKIPIEAKVMVINMVILKAVEYTINFTVLNKTLANTLTKAIFCVAPNEVAASVAIHWYGIIDARDNGFSEGVGKSFV